MNRPPESAPTEPLVTVGIAVWNGEEFLREALDSLLGQDHKNLEIILLDNISTDRTSAICLECAATDPRVHYVLDSQRRPVIDAQNRVAALARGEYFMGACDDDVYEPTYVSGLLRRLHSAPDVGLVYSAYDYISPEGVRTPAHRNSIHFINPGDSRFRNFRHYLYAKYPIPFVFGLMRTEVHRKCLPYYRRVDDHFRWDHDNLYMLRLLSLTKVDSVPEVLFHYRQRDRDALYAQRGQAARAPSGFRWYQSDVAHETKVTKMIFRIVDDARFSLAERLLLELHALWLYGLNCTVRSAVTLCRHWLHQRPWWPQVRDRIRSVIR